MQKSLFEMTLFVAVINNFSFSDVLDREEKEFSIEKVDFHENYNVGPYLNNDIAIVTLRQVK
jgi:hypothetical protein